MQNNLALTYIICIIFSFNFVKSETRLEQVHVLFRHGERSPTGTYPNDPHKNFNWPGGWGHLTNRGKLQMYRVGQKIREQYKNFLPEFYWKEDVKIFSSFADRCLMSADLVSAGLYPPKGEQIWNKELLWQPIPVSYLPRSQDNSIAMKSRCDAYDDIFEKVMNSAKVQTIFDENKELFKDISDHAGIKINDLGTVETLFYTLEIEQLNNLTLPAWINDTLMEKMGVFAAQNLALYSETEFMKRMKGGVYLKNVVTSMENMLEKQTEPKMLLYSGHDLTIVHVWRTLNFGELLRPGFGASLTFELYSNGEVKMIYRHSWNGPPEVKMLSSCESPCVVEHFKQALQPMLPVDWEKECNLTTQFKEGTTGMRKMTETEEF